MSQVISVDLEDDVVDKVEFAVGMGCNAWDCVKPKEIIAAVLNIYNVPDMLAELAFQRQRAYMRNDIVSADRISTLIGAKLPSVHEGEA